MNNTAIRKYAFNVPSTIGIEAKSLDFLWEKAPMTEKIHRAGFYHLIWVEKGKLSLMVDFEELRLQDNDAFLISPGQICNFNLQSHPQGFSVLFVPEFLGEASSDAQLIHRIFSVNPLEHKIISLRGLPISNLMQQLIHELQSEADEYQLVVARSCLRILLAEVARRLPQTTANPNKLVRRFFEEVEKHHHQWHNVSDYLPLLSAPEKLLSESVRLTTGMTPKIYLDQRRVLEAKRFLAYSELSVKEIAFSLGFDETTNFCKFFRKHTKISPNEFRLVQTRKQ
ncbi:MAG: helix-turn-helix transcriptional regulator [Prevotellaceae bacterium]|nr:helix-turn-helix transcriptional regulator [Prevotellaceae bacterium]